MKLVPTLALGVALLGSGAAFAQPASPPSGRPGPRPGAVLFEQVDVNRDGRVTWEEGWAFVTARFNAADADRSGGLTLQEFGTLRLMDRPAEANRPQRQPSERGQQMRAGIFRSFDANSDGIVTLAEIQPFAQARFRMIDANSDGAITRDEMPRPNRRHHHRHHHHRGERGAPAAPAAPAQ